MARPSGCSLAASTAAARRSTSSSVTRTPATSRTAGVPFVSVPVLSNSTVSTVRIRSRASRSFTRIPDRAETAVEIEMTSGIARPSACGHEITSTVTLRSTASDAFPITAHTMNVTTPTVTAT